MKEENLIQDLIDATRRRLEKNNYEIQIAMSRLEYLRGQEGVYKMYLGELEEIKQAEPIKQNSEDAEQ